VILLALLLGSIGTADLVRTRFGTVRTLWAAAAAGILVFLLAAAGSGLAWWWSPVAAAAIIGWTLCTRESGTALRTRGHRSGYWAVGALALAVIVVFAFGSRVPAASGPLVDWYTALPYAALDRVEFATFALTAGFALFLVESANIVVRLALRGERSSTEPVTASVAPEPETRRWWRRSRVPASPAVSPAVPSFTELKGGRFIGPLERLFVLALLLTSEFTALAAVIAAKGIVRFPEISKDATGGSKAEYFLVGSFASWALVVVAALVITVAPTNP